MRKPCLWAVSLLLAFSLSLSAPGIRAEEEAGLITNAGLDAFKASYIAEPFLFPLDSLVTLGETPYRAGLLGKYVLLNLWATWCPYCSREKASVQRLYERYESENFTILTISLGETVNTVQDYMASNGYTFPVAVDTRNGLRETYAPRVPTTYILNREGYAVIRINGSKEWDAAESLQILSHVIPGFEERDTQ